MVKDFIVRALVFVDADYLVPFMVEKEINDTVYYYWPNPVDEHWSEKSKLIRRLGKPTLIL